MDDFFLDQYSDDFGGLSGLSAEEAKPLEKPLVENNKAQKQDVNKSDGFGLQSLQSIESPQTLAKNKEAS